MSATVQTAEELDKFYASDDPWSYDTTRDDQERKSRLLSLLPSEDFARTLDIGCGNGFLTLDLPGKEVIGTDISASAIAYAQRRAATRKDADRFRFEARSLFDLQAAQLGTFDLVVITGVLYPQYIGKAFASVRLLIDALLRPDGCLVSCHIDPWSPWRFPYTAVDLSFYSYREHMHRLEIFKK